MRRVSACLLACLPARLPACPPARMPAAAACGTAAAAPCWRCPPRVLRRLHITLPSHRTLLLPLNRHADNFSVEEKKAARELSKSCNLNLAAAHLKLGAHAAARKAADQVGAGAEGAGGVVPGRSCVQPWVARVLGRR